MKVYVVTHVVEPHDHERTAERSVVAVHLTLRGAQAEYEESGVVVQGLHGRETVYHEIEPFEVGI